MPNPYSQFAVPGFNLRRRESTPEQQAMAAANNAHDPTNPLLQARPGTQNPPIAPGQFAGVTLPQFQQWWNANGPSAGGQPLSSAQPMPPAPIPFAPGGNDALPVNAYAQFAPPPPSYQDFQNPGNAYMRFAPRY